MTGEEDPACKNHALSAVRYALDSLRPNEQSLQVKMEQNFRMNESRLTQESTR
jgi:hypothetical protein